jgi:hypothetical protein
VGSSTSGDVSGGGDRQHQPSGHQVIPWELHGSARHHHPREHGRRPAGNLVRGALRRTAVGDLHRRIDRLRDGLGAVWMKVRAGDRSGGRRRRRRGERMAVGRGFSSRCVACIVSSVNVSDPGEAFAGGSRKICPFIILPPYYLEHIRANFSAC